MIPKVLLVYKHRPMCVGLFFRYAFRQAGCEVRTAGTAENEVYGHRDWIDFEAPSYPVQHDAAYDVSQLLAALPDWQPDLVVMIDQYDHFYLTGCCDPPFLDVSVENWNAEQHRRSKERSATKNYYMIQHDNWGREPQPPVPDGAEWMVFGADPFVHPYLNLPRTKFVCQIGSPYDPRPALWNTLRARFDGAPAWSAEQYHRDLAISERTIFGKVFHYGGMADAYNQSFTAISCSNVDFVPMRAAEAFAMGAILLSDNVPSMCAAFGNPMCQFDAEGSLFDAVPYKSDGLWVAHTLTPESIAAAIDWLTNNREYASAIRQHALAAVYERYTYCHSARRMLDAVGLRGATRMI